MKTKSIIIACITVLMMFGNTVTAFAKTIPEYYSTFIGSRTHKNWGFEFDATNIMHMQKGETYKMPEKQADGTVLRFYYVSDGNNTMRLATPEGEVITREELESYFANKPQAQPKTTTVVTDTTPAVNAKTKNSKSVPDGILEKDIAIWSDEDYELYKNEFEAIQLINEERSKAGLNPVTLNIDLCKVARIKAEEMVTLDYFSHESPNYGAHADTVRKFGIECKYAGENIARIGGSNAVAVVWNWMHSEGHKKHMLNPKHTEIGIGVAVNGHYSYWSLFMIY